MEKSIKMCALTICRNVGQYVRWLLLGALTGIVVGSVSSLFSWCLVHATNFRTSHHYTFLLLPLGGLIIVFLYKKLKYEENKGTDSVIESIHSDISLSPRMAFLIFVSTVITIFCGGSVGREGAALQIGGSLGKTLGDILRFNDKDKRIIIMSGIAAAFSTLFGTPMTASFFAIEVASIGTMYYAALVPCICAALIAKQMAILMGVKEDIFHVANDLSLSVPSGLKVVFLAACCAAVSILF